MNIDEVLSELYSFKLSDLIPLTTIRTDSDKADKQNNGYICCYTVSEWEKLFPEIGSKHIFYAPVISCAPIVYYDASLCIWLNIPLFAGQEQSDSFTRFRNDFREIINTRESQARNGEWDEWMFAMPDSARMEAICTLLTRTSTTEQKAKVYSLFKEYYPLSDCFTSMFPRNFAQKLMRAKSDEQRAKTRSLLDSHFHDEKIVVYRGYADKSATIERALSWTVDINVARKFALRAGKHPQIATGIVAKKDIIEYFDGAEREVVVLPGSVSVTEYGRESQLREPWEYVKN